MATGVISAMFGVGTAIGLVVGGVDLRELWMEDDLPCCHPSSHWRNTARFYKLQESPVRYPSKVDVIGATTFSIAILTFLVAMTEG